MQKNAVSILGASEVRWKGQGEIRSGDYTVYYSVAERAEKGVTIVVIRSILKSVVQKVVYNDRNIAIKLQAEPINILMTQVYMITQEHEDDEVEELYDVIEEILEEDGKGDTTTIVMGAQIVLLEMNRTGTLLDHMAQEERIAELNCLLNFVKEMG